MQILQDKQEQLISELKEIEEDLKKIAGLGKGIFDKDAVTFQKELREER